MFHRVLLFLLALFLVFSCAGYHFNMGQNPLISYGIRSIAVPNFINRTNLPNLGAMMTKELVLALNDFSGLKVYGGDNESADAVLVGILESNNLINETVKTSESLFTDNAPEIKKSIGNRASFSYPSKSRYEFRLKYILIKRPTKRELDFFTSDIKEGIELLHPKIVLQDYLPIAGSFDRVVKDSQTSTSAGAVNFVKNNGIMTKSLEGVCKDTALNFKNVVLNAF